MTARIVIIVLFYLLAVAVPAVMFWKLFQAAWPDGNISKGGKIMRGIIIGMLVLVALLGLLIIRKFT